VRGSGISGSAEGTLKGAVVVKQTHFRFLETEMADRLLPLLEGRVFHVTSLASLPAILAAGAIEPNLDSAFETTFGHSRNSYFRARGCVSLFDLRGPRPEGSLERCWPFRPAVEGRGLAVFVVSLAACADLRPWTGWEEERAFGEMIVPYVEAGHKGRIPLTLIDEAIELEVEENPDPVVAILRKGRKRAAERGPKG
jgi:hypothetical protein